MENLRRFFNKSDREQAQRDTLDLRFYILPILLARQNYTCNRCKELADKYDIDHLIYNPKVTINEAVDLAKEFSTLNSGKFVNGILDAMFIVLKEEGRIDKKGKGLIEQTLKTKNDDRK